jgi:endonuclease YncB( thermonuclease family)
MYACGGRSSLHHRLAIVAIMAVMVAGGARADDRPRCTPPAIGTASVETAVDGRTVRLADGRELRLAGIDAPHRGDAAAHAAKAALQSLVAGREVGLLRLGPESDRYGRLSALVRQTVTSPAEGQYLQLALLAAGHARVAARVGDAACAAEFLVAERAARAAGLGLWAEPHYLIKKAENPVEVLAQRGRFAVVEGKALSVRESGATIYVNFGRRWSEDFTVTILKRNQRRFTAAGLNLRDLAGRHVRVRGTIEERGGPWIEAMHPEQIEIAERD